MPLPAVVHSPACPSVVVAALPVRRPHRGRTPGSAAVTVAALPARADPATPPGSLARCRPGSDGLAVPVVGVVAEERPAPLVGPGPPAQHQLPAVHLHRGAREGEVRHEQDARGLAATWFVILCAPSGPLGKRTQSPGSSSRSPSGVPQRRPSRGRRRATRRSRARSGTGTCSHPEAARSTLRRGARRQRVCGARRSPAAPAATSARASPRRRGGSSPRARAYSRASFRRPTRRRAAAGATVVEQPQRHPPEDVALDVDPVDEERLGEAQRGERQCRARRGVGERTWPRA